MEDRIVVKRNKKYKVNKQLAEEIQTIDKTTVAQGDTLLSDERFTKLFNDKNFEIDYSSEMFKPVHTIFTQFRLRERSYKKKQI